MSLGIRSKTINWIVSAAPRNRMASFCNRSADLIGSCLQGLTRGLYRRGLSRGAVELTANNMIKTGDILTIKSGQVMKEGEIIYTNNKLFKGINIEKVEVTEEMSTAEGMASHLRWDIIGNRPRLLSRLVPTLGALTFGLFHFSMTSIHDDISLRGALSFLLLSFTYIPYYKIAKLPMFGFREDPINLQDVESLRISKYYFWGGYRSSMAFVDMLLPGTFFVNRNKSQYLHNHIIETHEKAHLLGASDDTAYKISDEKLYKTIIFEKTKFNTMGHLLLGKSILDSFMGVGRANIFSFMYSLQGSTYYTPTYGKISNLANNKQAQSELIEEFERQEVELRDDEAAILYRMHGDLKIALFYYHKLLISAKSRRSSSMKYLQEIHFAIAITQKELGNFTEARKSFEHIIELGKNSDYYFVAKTELDL